jgi:acyl-coenzyme A synthetase/AMP-(fatty) acid ligase
MDPQPDDVVRATAEWSWAGTLHIVMLGNLYCELPTTMPGKVRRLDRRQRECLGPAD